MKKYIEIVDNVVMMAYAEGFTMPKKEVWDMYAVKSRLNAYGYTDNEGRYFLNEKGMEYVLSGCNEGIKAKIKRQEEIELLDIETKKFTKKKQKWTFRFAVISLVISLISILTQVGLLSKILQWISDLAQWICYILS